MIHYKKLLIRGLDFKMEEDIEQWNKYKEYVNDSLRAEFEMTYTPQEMLDLFIKEQREYDGKQDYFITYQTMSIDDTLEFEDFKNSLFEEYKEMRLE